MASVSFFSRRFPEMRLSSLKQRNDAGIQLEVHIQMCKWHLLHSCYICGDVVGVNRPSLIFLK
jgi:hypothetical protein